jgi:hypothetical protein
LFARTLASKKLARSCETARALLLKVPSPRCAAQLEGARLPHARGGPASAGGRRKCHRGAPVRNMPADDPIADFRCSRERPEGARVPFVAAPNRRQPAFRAHKPADSQTR